MKMEEIQVIKNNGKPEWAVIPYATFLALEELQEIEELSKEREKFQSQLERGEEELIPQAMVDRLLNGENAIRVWREYREMTQAALAKLADISTPYLSQIENNGRTASTRVLKSIAKALKLGLDDLV